MTYKTTTTTLQYYIILLLKFFKGTSLVSIISKSTFIKMPWKNGGGVTTQISIFPKNATLENDNYLYRISSASIEKDCDFSPFPGKRRLLIPIKGSGFNLNSNSYEKFEIADFSGDVKTSCTLLKGPVVDLGIILNPEKVQAQAKILNLKSEIQFSLNTQSEYIITVLSGELEGPNHILSELEALHFKEEEFCHLKPVKNSILLFLKMEINP